MKSIILKRKLETYFTTDMIVNSGSKISLDIQKFENSKIKYGISEIITYYNEIDPLVSVFTKDEQFARFIGSDGL